MPRQNETKKAYSYLGIKSKIDTPVSGYHFDFMQAAIDEPIVRGALGIENGSGPGYDTYCAVKYNPSVNLASMDISDGIYRTEELTKNLVSVRSIKCSAMEIPFKSKIFDFAYSFGVIHHTNDLKKCMLESARVFKKNSPVFLYENHSENPVKFLAVKIVSLISMLTVMMPARALFALCTIASPIVFVMFTIPYKILAFYRSTKRLAEQMPFYFGTHPFSLRADLCDRFSAPAEARFSRK